MCDPDGSGLESLMGVFRLPNEDIRVIRRFLSVFILFSSPKRPTFYFCHFSSVLICYFFGQTFCYFFISGWHSWDLIWRLLSAATERYRWFLWSSKELWWVWCVCELKSNFDLFKIALKWVCQSLLLQNLPLLSHSWHPCLQHRLITID